MKRIIKLSESDMVSLIKKVILEQYSPEKLYKRTLENYFLRRTKRERRNSFTRFRNCSKKRVNGLKKNATEVIAK
jgi:hypothetical protein